ncbi:hypothetical protein Y032_0032g2513 [Ancylostoma ceylanicum]|uniref:Uncharacterized protein n=1 Tax=Ancylostoma ceylanicum TaxID=53326 RepID=A0A016UNQ1_9BILA|nr:hypothetical protein Y032_0032g2513 [Ancylostoma ceylanicum]
MLHRNLPRAQKEVGCQAGTEYNRVQRCMFVRGFAPIYRAFVQERDKPLGTHVTLKCFPRYDSISMSACKRYTQDDKHLGCACFRDGCNVEFLLNRHPTSRVAVLPSLPSVHEWKPDGELLLQENPSTKCCIITPRAPPAMMNFDKMSN